MTRTSLKNAAARSMAGFTLVELLIVIGVIVLLVGITLVVGTAVIERSERQQTEMTLSILDAAYNEYRSSLDRDVLYGVPGQPNQNSQYEVLMESGAQDSVANETTNRLMAYVIRVESARSVLARLPEGTVEFKELNGGQIGGPTETIVVRDAWDKQIIMVHQGRRWNRTFDYPSPQDSDGTIRTPLEIRLGVAANARPYFVSAGPSGNFDDVSDNVYSERPAVMPEDQ